MLCLENAPGWQSCPQNPLEETKFNQKRSQEAQKTHRLDSKMLTGILYRSTDVDMTLADGVVFMQLSINQSVFDEYWQCVRPHIEPDAVF